MSKPKSITQDQAERLIELTEVEGHEDISVIELNGQYYDCTDSTAQEVVKLITEVRRNPANG